jgi:hypothetical protein
LALRREQYAALYAAGLTLAESYYPFSTQQGHFQLIR